MAVNTSCPFPLVPTTVYRKILRVMLLEYCRHPVRIGGVAIGAVGGEIGSQVVGAQRGFVVALVAGNTVRRCIGKGAAGMAFRAIHDVVPFFQREKTMINQCGVPAVLGRVMAICAVGGKTGLRVIRTGRALVIIQVAIDTIVADPVKSQVALGSVAVDTVGRSMCPQQREAIVNMQLGNIINQPVVSGVAPCAVHTHGLLVHIGMAGNAG